LLNGEGGIGLSPVSRMKFGGKRLKMLVKTENIGRFFQTRLVE